MIRTNETFVDITLKWQQSWGLKTSAAPSAHPSILLVLKLLLFDQLYSLPNETGTEIRWKERKKKSRREEEQVDAIW